MRKVAAISFSLLILMGCKKEEPPRVEQTASEPRPTATAAAAAPEPPRKPTVLAKLHLPKDLALDASFVYVADEDVDDPNASADIVRIPIEGGPPTILAKKQRAGQSLVVTTANLYWLRGGDSDRNIPDAVVKMPLKGGTPSTVAKTFIFADAALATDGTNLYFGGSGDVGISSVMKLPIAGGQPSKISSADEKDSIRVIAVDATNVYWLSTGKLYKAPLAGGQAQELATVQNVWGLTSDGKHLYWTDKGKDLRGSGTVRRVPVAGGAVETLASGLSLPWGIAVDDRAVYWVTNGDGAGAVMKVAKGGGPVSVLVRNQHNPVHIALSTTHVYWTNASGDGGGTVCRVAK